MPHGGQGEVGSHQGLTCPILRGPFHTKHCAQAGGGSRRRKEANRSPVSPCPQPPLPDAPRLWGPGELPQPLQTPQKTRGHAPTLILPPPGRASPPAPRQEDALCLAYFWITATCSRGRGRRKRGRDGGRERKRRREKGWPVAVGGTDWLPQLDMGWGCGAGEGGSPRDVFPVEHPISRILKSPKINYLNLSL